MSKQIRVPDPVYEKAKEVSEGRDMTIGEAVRFVFVEAGYDV